MVEIRRRKSGFTETMEAIEVECKGTKGKGTENHSEAEL